MSENRMNNITMAVNLNLSQALDMTYIWMKKQKRNFGLLLRAM